MFSRVNERSIKLYLHPYLHLHLTHLLPFLSLYPVELDLCKSLKQDTSLPAEESCPQGTRICLKKINKHKGQSDRLLQVIPIAGQTENGDAVSMTFSHVPESGKYSKTREKRTREELSTFRLDLIISNKGFPSLIYNLFSSCFSTDKSTLTLRGPTYNKIEQQADLDLTCDESISNGDSVPIFESYDELKGVLNLSWKHKTFCSKSGGDSGGGKKPSDEKDGEKESSSGWGFFSWFFFL